MLEISREYGESNRLLDDEAREVLLKCWRMLTQALETGEIQAPDLEEFTEQKVVCNGQGLLSRPDWIFFEDRAGLAKQFRQFAANNIVIRPEGAWQAIRAAGSKWLSEAVESRLVECVQPVEDAHLSGLIQARRAQLIRVFEAHQASGLDVQGLGQIRLVGTADRDIPAAMTQLPGPLTTLRHSPGY